MSKKNSLIAMALIAVLASFAYFVFFKRGQGISIGPAAVPTPPSEQEKDRLAEENMALDGAAKQAAFIPVPAVSDADHVLGSVGAPVEIIVYSDFECEFCGQLNADLARLRREYPEQVAVAFRHYPMRSHANAYQAALAAECAGEQGKFWEMHDALSQANASGTLGIVSFGEIAKGLSLDSRGFLDCLENAKFSGKVRAQSSEADAAGATGVPALFINGRPYAGALPYDDFIDSQGIKREGLRTIIEKELKP